MSYPTPNLLSIPKCVFNGVIIRHLDIVDVLNCALVCKRLNLFTKNIKEFLDAFKHLFKEKINKYINIQGAFCCFSKKSLSKTMQLLLKDVESIFNKTIVVYHQNPRIVFEEISDDCIMNSCEGALSLSFKVGKWEQFDASKIQNLLIIYLDINDIWQAYKTNCIHWDPHSKFINCKNIDCLPKLKYLDIARLEIKQETENKLEISFCNNHFPTFSYEDAKAFGKKLLIEQAKNSHKVDADMVKKKQCIIN